MTEIEKMFENAGIKPLCQIPDKFCGVQNIYEDFTAEKQIELIKWLAKIYEVRINWAERENSYHFIIRDYTNRRLNYSVCDYEIPFEETLAYLINIIWQNLTDQEKEEIRGILNE